MTNRSPKIWSKGSTYFEVAMLPSKYDIALGADSLCEREAIAVKRSTVSLLARLDFVRCKFAYLDRESQWFPVRSSLQLL